MTNLVEQAIFSIFHARRWLRSVALPLPQVRGPSHQFCCHVRNYRIRKAATPARISDPYGSLIGAICLTGHVLGLEFRPDSSLMAGHLDHEGVALAGGFSSLARQDEPISSGCQ
jgi:hypothetical protein